MRRFVRRTVAVLVLAVLPGCSAAQPGRGPVAAPAATAPSVSPEPVKPVELPLGGTRIFPAYRVVAYYGTAGNRALGVLGEGSPDVMLSKLRRAAAGFAGDRKIQVAYELIVTVAQAGAGRDGDYSRAIPDTQIQRY